MRRTNELVAHTMTHHHRRCLCEWFVANCALWNELTYRRRQAYFDPAGDVWGARTHDLYERYGPVTGTGTAQQVKRKSDEAWRAFFTQLDDYHAGTRQEKPSPPGSWGNRGNGYELRGIVRNDLYEIEWDPSAKTSTLSFGVGKELKAKYGIGHTERLTLALQGAPRWQGKNCRLELAFDETTACIRVHHTVEVQPAFVETLRRAEFTHTPEQGNATVAAIDIGANNTLAVFTDAADALVFRARPLFRRFRTTTEQIADLQSHLPSGAQTSERIRRRYAARTGRRDHHRDAAIKHAAQWLRAQGVSKVYVGDLRDVLSTHWSAEVNEKTHQFWSHGQVAARLDQTLDLAEIEIERVPETGTSSSCPHCESEQVTRSGDSLHCSGCGLETHADVAGAGNLLAAHTNLDIKPLFRPQPRPMARPAAHDPGRAWDGDHDYTVTDLKWDDHEWKPTRTERAGTLGSLDQRGVCKPASSTGATAGCVAHAGISLL